MKEVSYMSDFLAVRLLVMAQDAEIRFGECLESCEHGADGTIRIDESTVFTRLLDHRVSELLLGLAAFEAYLGYYSAETARRIEAEHPTISLAEYLEKLDLLELFKKQSTNFKRRHELIMDENGARPLSRFLTDARLTLEEKFLYWPMVRTRKTLSYKDGYVKKMIKLLRLRDELSVPALESTHEMRTAPAVSDVAAVFLHHPIPDSLTPGKSCSDRVVVEAYAQEHFLWELLHCYPAREVQEAIQYLHKLDRTDNHFISVIRPALLVDEAGEPITRPVRQYVLDLRLET